jgi:hypothetical protein
MAKPFFESAIIADGDRSGPPPLRMKIPHPYQENRGAWRPALKKASACPTAAV